MQQPDTFLGLTQTAWAGLTALAALATLLVAAGALIFAWRQIHVAVQQMKLNQQAQEEADRPYVVVTLEHSPASNTVLDLVVANIGRRPAFDSIIRIEPPPTRAREIAGAELADTKILNAPVSLLAPGQTMRIHYDSVLERQGRSDLPTEHRVTVEYRDSAKRKYSEVIHLDVEAYKGAAATTVYTVHDVAKSLREIQNRLAKASVLAPSGFINVRPADSPDQNT